MHVWTLAPSVCLQSNLPDCLLGPRELLFSCVCLSCSPQAPQPQAPETPWADEENVVYHLTDEDFDKFLKDHSSVLVMFHAPCEFVFVLFCTLRQVLASKINDDLLWRFHRALNSKFRLFLFVIFKYTRHEMFVKLLTSSIGQRCADGRDTL